MEKSNSELSEKTVEKNPFQQFQKWYDEVIKEEISWGDAANLVTVNSDCKPSARIILLKEFDEKGFIFFTNYSSKKSNDLQSNPHASLLFYWKEFERQIRIEGVIEKLGKDKSEKYFHSRPRESQIGAWASDQSKKIPNRQYLDDRFAEFEKKFGKKEIPLPEFWGGYRLIPEYFEFWQSRENRLHDRICYEVKADTWQIFRLAP
jgi:pyridoxamine 5'-phosphate oxidase